MAKLTRPERAASCRACCGTSTEHRAAADPGREERARGGAARREAGCPSGRRSRASGRRCCGSSRRSGRPAQAQAARGAAQEADAREAPRWKEWVEKRSGPFAGRRPADGGAGGDGRETGVRALDREMAEALKAREQLDGLWRSSSRSSGSSASWPRSRRYRKRRPPSGGRGQLAELMRTMAALDRRIAELHRRWRRSSEWSARRRHSPSGSSRRAGREEQRAVGPGKGIRQHAPRRPAEAVRRSQGATGQDRALGPKGRADVPATSAVSSGGAGILDARCRRSWTTASISGNASSSWPSRPRRDRRGGGTRSTVGRKPPGERARRRAARQSEERDRAARNVVASRPGPGARRVDSRTADRLRPQRHDTVRAELTKLEPVALEAAKLAERAKRAEILVKEAELAEQALSVHERRARQLAAAVAAERFSETRSRGRATGTNRAARALREAELAVAETRGELTAAETGIPRSSAEAGRTRAESGPQIDERAVQLVCSRGRS